MNYVSNPECLQRNAASRGTSSLEGQPSAHQISAQVTAHLPSTQHFFNPAVFILYPHEYRRSLQLLLLPRSHQAASLLVTQRCYIGLSRPWPLGTHAISGIFGCVFVQIPLCHRLRCADLFCLYRCALFGMQNNGGHSAHVDRGKHNVCRDVVVAFLVQPIHCSAYIAMMASFLIRGSQRPHCWRPALGAMADSELC